MPDPGLSTLENAWRAVLWTASQRNFPFTPFVRVPTHGRPSGLLLLAGCTLLALLAMTFQIHMAGLHVLPIARSADPTAADSLAEFGSSTLEALMGGMQLSRVTPWATTVLLATAAALVLQLGLMRLVIAIGRLRGARAMTIDGLSYWLIQPVTWTAISAFAVGILLVGLRVALGGGRHPLMADVAFALSLSGCFAGMAMPVVILVLRMSRHGRRLASTWEWVATLLLLTSPVALLTNSAWRFATDRAIARSPEVHVRALQSCDGANRTCTIALSSSNAPELELVDDVRVKLRITDAKGQWQPQMFEMHAKLLNEGEPRGTPVVLFEGKRRYALLQFDPNQPCEAVLRQMLRRRDVVPMQATFHLAGAEFSPSGEASWAQVKSDNPSYLQAAWRSAISQACIDS
ncbi:MAG: hypothetical protein J7598_10835 [Mitsuaria chitosanitabida]|uniref:hypothetical protein n=1 Tax=Roseateles chitosanitabidus TaxID=65048 RepID=UPI001B240A56|nr:hypothetical protein [Roseateles chitosanitabidus]MBO9687101.1 hypothetical protein [Roseateles chitosanitabidus]